MTHAPDFAEPLVGWRMWRFGGESLDLRSVDSPTTWAPGAAHVARCRSYVEAGARTHAAPVATCSCGVYAYDSEALVRAYLPAYRQQAQWRRSAEVDAVWGEVFLWGHVVLHAHGFRAEFGYPKRVVVPAGFRRLVDELDGRTLRRIDAEEAAAIIGSRYGVEVEVEACPAGHTSAAAA